MRSCCEARNEEHAGNERRSRSSRRRHNETSLQKALLVRQPFGARQWHVPCVSSLGIRHLPGSSRGSLLQLQYTLKSWRFQKWFATNCPAAMVVDAADQTVPQMGHERRIFHVRIDGGFPLKRPFFRCFLAKGPVSMGARPRYRVGAVTAGGPCHEPHRAGCC